jgi:flagellar biosynthesis GTPase FlhF
MRSRTAFLRALVEPSAIAGSRDVEIRDLSSAARETRPGLVSSNELRARRWHPRAKQETTMSHDYKLSSIGPFLLLSAAALFAGAHPATAQRPGGQAEPQRPPPAPAPAPTRPEPPPAPPPTREQETAAQQQQREANARAQQQELQQREANARAQQQQEQQRIENARQEQQARDQERIANARKEAAPTRDPDPKYRSTVERLFAAEHVHREQLARINRLKQIAERQRQEQRIGDLNDLLLRSNRNFDQQLAAAKTELPEPEYNNVVAMLEQGRRREVRSMMAGGGGGDEGSAAQRVPTSATQRAPTAPARPANPPAPAPAPTRPPH